MTPNTIVHGDAIAELRKLPDECFDCVITSPPYWGLRDYGVAGQLGLEKTPEAFIQKMVDLFREVKRVIKKEGTLWLNIGDSYATRSPNGGQGKNGQRADRRNTNLPMMAKGSGNIKPKDLVGIPWMLAFALRADGWYLRQDIIWHKPNPMPESVTDRCTKSHEYVFLMSKSKEYYFDSESIKTPATSVSKKMPDGWDTGSGAHGSFHRKGREKGKTFSNKQGGGGSGFKGHSGNHREDGSLIGAGFANRRSVWSIATMAFSEAHFATFPEKLIEPMILAGTPPNGIVLDPFMGAGTTGLVAKKLGRQYLGIELNAEYIKIAEKRIGNVPNSLF